MGAIPTKGSCYLVTKSCLQPHGLQPTRLLCPWDFPGQNTGVECHFCLQGLFPTGIDPGLFLALQADSLPLSHQRSCRQGEEREPISPSMEEGSSTHQGC